MVDEFNDLTVMHDYAWTLILRGTVDHKSPARHPTFGTIGLQGMPELRTVVLRQADQKSASLEVHTDLKSAKVKELKSNPLSTPFMQRTPFSSTSFPFNPDS